MQKIIATLLSASFVAYMTFYIGFLNIPTFTETIKETTKVEVKNPYYKAKEEALLGFIQEHMLGINGEVFSNIKPPKEGVQTLAESVGLLMNYSVLAGRKDLFNLEYNYLNNKLLVDRKFIRWVEGTQDTSCNAAIDDLRIVDALLNGYAQWGNQDYMDTANAIQETIFKKQLKDGSLCEFYDWKQDKVRFLVPLCYLDFSTMQKLETFNKDWSHVIDKGLEVLKNGQIPKSPMLFKKYYNYTSGKYSYDEEYSKTKGICLTYTLYTAIHLTELKQDTQPLAEWLKKEMEKGKLYAWYNPHTLQPAHEMESTGVYALAAVYACKTGDEELYKKFVDKMLEFMIDDEDSKYYGGFGIEETLDFYSFDNLTALWALVLANSRTAVN